MLEMIRFLSESTIHNNVSDVKHRTTIINKNTYIYRVIHTFENEWILNLPAPRYRCWPWLFQRALTSRIDSTNSLRFFEHPLLELILVQSQRNCVCESSSESVFWSPARERESSQVFGSRRDRSCVTRRAWATSAWSAAVHQKRSFETAARTKDVYTHTHTHVHSKPSERTRRDSMARTIHTWLPPAGNRTSSTPLGTHAAKIEADEYRK